VRYGGRINPAFAHIVEALDAKFQTLIVMAPVRYNALPMAIPERGVYLFSDGKGHLYVGRTNRIRRRLAGHCRASSTHFSATFAFRIARKEAGLLKASYKPKGSRAELVEEKEFRSAFESAKDRLRNMNLRFIEETDPIRHALLEIYVAVVLRTPYNDFDNH
jgi:predicted GIY-YIG superfamily endonuclease